jgi:hypothetical protein
VSLLRGAYILALPPWLFEPAENPSTNEQSCKHSPEHAGVFAREKAVRRVLKRNDDRTNDDERDQELRVLCRSAISGPIGWIRIQHERVRDLVAVCSGTIHNQEKRQPEYASSTQPAS